jgi:hypothetical protein
MTLEMLARSAICEAWASGLGTRLPGISASQRMNILSCIARSWSHMPRRLFAKIHNYEAFSTFINTRGLTRICPGLASSQSREATLDTVPMAA